MPDPLRRLFSRLDGGPVTLTDDDRRDLSEDWDALAAAGVIVETERGKVVECDSCDEPHYAAVFAFEVDGDPTRWFHRCPSFGSVPLDPERLRRWAVRVPALGRALTGRDAEERVPELIWRLGLVGSTARVGWLVAGWRGRTGIADAARELLAPNAVVFVPCRLPTVAAWGTVPPLVVPLAEVLSVTGTGVEVNRASLAAFLPPEPVAVVTRNDRPRLTLPPGTPWEDVTLVVEDHHLELRLGAVRHRVGYEDLGLDDGRTGAPNAVWLTLVRLAQTGELTTGDQTKTKQATLKNNVSKLRVALKHWCGLPGDPFHPVHPFRPYRPRFRVYIAKRSNWGEIGN